MARHPFTIVFAGGGSGGHVYPTLAVIDELKKDFEEARKPVRFIRMGPRDGYETLFMNRGVEISPIVAAKMRRYASFQNIIDAPKFLIEFCQALFKLYFIMPEIVFSKGGVGALPVVLAAWFYRIPVAVHESDARPGITNLFSARFSRRVFVGFQAAADYFAADKTVVVGNPVRAKLLAGKTTKELAKETLGFSTTNPLTLVIGGSQGSTRINEFLLENLAPILEITQVLHQTGTANFTEVSRLSHAVLMEASFQNRYQAIGYFDDDQKFGLALTAADLAIIRPGASSITELAAFGVPAILIPAMESANDHQRINAYEFAKAGAGVVIEEPNLLPGIFLNQLKTIVGDADLRAKMSASAGRFYAANAAEKIAEELIVLGIRS